MIHITQLIYLVEGQEGVFDQFEAVAIPLIAKYNGRLTLRIRPNEDSSLKNLTKFTWWDLMKVGI